jgi:hypothetical protein
VKEYKWCFKLKVNYKDLLVAFCFIVLLLGVLVLANSSDIPIDIKILSIENVGDNLEVNTSFIYSNGTPYTGSVALKSTAPPGFQPSTQDWEYIPSDGLKTFLIQNRQISDFDSITIYAEPAEQYNTSWYYNTIWNSPLDNTTVNQTINQGSNNTTIDVNINTTSNSSIPVIIISNNTNTSIIINTSSTGTGNSSITINDTDNIQTIINGKITSGTPNNPDSYKGYKSVKSPVYHNNKHNNVNNNTGVGMRNCNIDPVVLLIIMLIFSVLIVCLILNS